MHPNNLIKYSLLLISTVSLLCIEQIVHACGGEMDPYDYYPSFFANTVANEPAYRPFFYTEYLKYYDEWYEADTINQMPDANIAEWSAYTGNAATLADVDSFVYRYPQADLSSLYYNIEKEKPLSIPAKMQDNTFTKWFQKDKDLEALGYLMYAKRCEPHAVNTADYWDPVKRDTSGNARLIKSGLQLYAAAKKDFIKWRYAFQVVRLAFYSDDYENTIALYNQLVGDKTANNLMYAKLLSLKAGALYKTGKKDEAAYLFSRTFDLSDDIKKSSFTSYDWSTDSSDEKVLAHCKNNHEKAVIYVMQGLNAFDEGLPYLQQAYAADPQVKGLDVIMTREINKMEQRYLEDKLLKERNVTASSYWGDQYYYNYYGNDEERNKKAQEYSNYTDQLNAFAQKVAKDDKVKSRAFWYLSSAYISFIKDDAKGCGKNLASAKKAGLNTREHDLHDIIHILYTIKSNPELTTKVEASLLPELQWLSGRAVNNAAFEKPYRDLMTTVLVTPYLKQKDTVKAIFCLSRPVQKSKNEYAGSFDDLSGTLLDGMTVTQLQSVEAYLQKKDKTPYDQWLVKNTPYDMTTLQELEGTKYIRLNQFDKAAAVLKNVPSSKMFEVPNAFVAYIKDQLDWDEQDSTTLYTKLSFSQKMMALKQRSDASPKDAKTAFDYACGLYSMSYYGKSHNLYTYYRGTSDGYAYYETPQRKKLPLVAQEFYGVYTAEKYFMQAFANSDNAEFKAKCLWMAAKCWQKRCPDNGENNNNYDSHAPDPYYAYSLTSPYYKQLKDQYAKTKFFKEASSTCAYFKDYLKKTK